MEIHDPVLLRQRMRIDDAVLEEVQVDADDMVSFRKEQVDEVRSYVTKVTGDEDAHELGFLGWCLSWGIELGIATGKTAGRASVPAAGAGGAAW
jgi:hypothetical protein